MRKNIVIFSDGTGQDGGVGNNTNVYSLFNMILDRSENQISYYDRGLGTGWRKYGAITGRGISKNVEEAYQFLSDNFNAGDRIFLFGFSRGATTVRTLSYFIALFGILPRSRPELFKRAWKIYKLRNRGKRRERASEFVRLNHTMWTKIRFIGVWDTVSALGLPFKKLNLLIDNIPGLQHSYHNFEMADSIEYGRHALAIDEERKVFRPLLWDERGPRKNGSGSGDRELFSINDFSDIYLVAQRLVDSDNVVSRRVWPRLTKPTQELLRWLLDNHGSRAAKKKAVPIRAVLVEQFNTVIKSGEPIYKFDSNPRKVEAELKQLEEMEQLREEGMKLSAATRECIDKLVPSFSFAPSPSPTLFDVSRLNRLLLEDAYSLKPRIKQVWFAGVHTDVGGGYAENELGQIPLLWMVSEAIDLGLLIYEKHKVDLKPDATGIMHDSRAGIARYYRQAMRQWNVNEHQGRSALVHESVVTRYAEDPSYEPWILKTEYDVDPWPNRLESSIQFDDTHIWREGLWGWGAKFDQPWHTIERISANERSLTIHVRDGDDIFISGSLPRALPALVERLERKREHLRIHTREQHLTKQDGDLKKQDAKLQQLHERLEKKVKKLEDYIDMDGGVTHELRKKNAEQDSQISQIDVLKAEIARLEAQAGDNSRARLQQ